MDISYLILAHNSPNHFHRLTESLLNPRSSIFVHIDKKTDITPFINNTKEKIFFCKKRIPVYWGEYSQVEAIIELLRFAKRSNNARYYVLLSGSDYPLRSAEYIKCFLAKNEGKQFINSIRIPNIEAGKPLTRLENYYPNSRKLPDIMKSKLFSILSLKPKIKKRNLKTEMGNIIPYGGSTWWAITDEAATYILEYIDRNKKFLKFLENTSCPDELLFQTILSNSPFKKNIQGNLTFVDWSLGGANPSLINIEHIRKFNENDKFIVDSKLYGKREILFARKFPDDSQELTDMLKR